MSFITAKFGGSSVCDAQMFRRVYDIISADPDRRYIVLSAPGKRSPTDRKITDLFLNAHAAKAPQDQFIFAQIFQRYASIRDALCPGFALEDELSEIFARLHTSRDYAASRGEYLCAKLFSAGFDIPFVDAKDILFFDRNGAIDRKKSFDAIRKRLSDCERVVIPGFYASDTTGIRTFSRGGSDVSGAWIAAAMNADLYENWTDVDGVFSADPAKIPDAVLHKRLSFRQMRQMALAGAKVLHPDALEPLTESGIPTVIRNSFRPEQCGTTITEDVRGYVPAVTGSCPVRFDERDLRNAVSIKKDSATRSVGVISVFGADEAAFREIHAKYKAVHIIHMPEHIQIITEIPQYQTVLADIHRILVKNIFKE